MSTRPPKFTQWLFSVPRLVVASLGARFGSKPASADSVRRADALPSWFDIAHAVGILKREPGLSVVAVLVLALGVSSTTTMYGLTHGLSRPLPIEDEADFVRIARHEARWRYTRLTREDFEILSADQSSLIAVAAAVDQGFSVSGSESRPERLGGTAISPRAFEMLRVRPLLGRTLNEDDASPNAPPVVLLGHDLWRRRFGDDDPLGQELRVNDQLRTIVGVMPDGFGFPRVSDLWVPLSSSASGAEGSGQRLSVFGRLRPGVSIDAADVEISGIGARIRAERPDDTGDARLRVEPFLEKEIAPEDRILINLMVMMAMVVLVIAATNVANVLLSRAAIRGKEAAVRMALGGSRWRVLSLRLIESLTLSTLGGAAGLILTHIALGLIRRTLAVELGAWWMDIRLDTSVFIVTVLCVFGATVVAGLLPAIQTSGIDLNSAMRAESGGSTSAKRGRISRFLVASQLTLSCAMLILCGTIVLGARQLDAVEYGFEPETVLTGHMFLADFDYPEREDRIEVRARLAQRLAAVPGVERVAFVSTLPGGQSSTRYLVEGESYSADQALPGAELRFVAPDFFEMFGVEDVEGRRFSPGDRGTGDRVAVINSLLARTLAPEGSALGRRFRINPASETDEWIRVIGVVNDPGVMVWKGKPSEGVYLPDWDMRSRAVRFAARVRPSESLITEVLAAVGEIDPDLPVYDTQLLSDFLIAENRPERMFAVIFGAFGLIAMTLAVVGLYGVVAFGVNQRVREIGVRKALGARGREIGWWTIQGGVVPLTSGLVLGVGIAWLVAPTLGELLFGADPHDPVMFSVVPLVLTFTAGCGLWLPARSAVRVDPASVLRAE